VINLLLACSIIRTILSTVPSTVDDVNYTAKTANEPSVSGIENFQICRPDDSGGYVCKGPKYDEFASQLKLLLLAKIDVKQNNFSSFTKTKPANWGK